MSESTISDEQIDQLQPKFETDGLLPDQDDGVSLTSGAGGGPAFPPEPSPGPPPEPGPDAEPPADISFPPVVVPPKPDAEPDLDLGVADDEDTIDVEAAQAVLIEEAADPSSQTRAVDPVADELPNVTVEGEI